MSESDPSTKTVLPNVCSPQNANGCQQAECLVTPALIFHAAVGHYCGSQRCVPYLTTLTLPVGNHSIRRTRHLLAGSGPTARIRDSIQATACKKAHSMGAGPLRSHCSWSCGTVSACHCRHCGTGLLLCITACYRLLRSCSMPCHLLH